MNSKRLLIAVAWWGGSKGKLSRKLKILWFPLLRENNSNVRKLISPGAAKKQRGIRTEM